MKKFTAVITKEFRLLICDGCGLQASMNDAEFYEFICWLNFYFSTFKNEIKGWQFHPQV